MTEPTKKVFSTAVGGYSRNEVDEYITWLRKTMQELESYNSLAVREQNSLRERVVQLEESLKLAKSPGYAQLGAQFEQTLRLAESEAAKLVNDAGKDAVRIRETAKAEAERIKFEAEEFSKPVVDGANREARRMVMQARKQSEEILEQAQDELRQVQAERAQLQKEANVIKSEADNHVAKVKADLQTEVE
ncbi:MAG: DivIVA domain-containing protein, partial [Aquiluna sp.]